LFRRCVAFLLFAARLAGRKEKKVLKKADLVMTENHWEAKSSSK